MRLFLFLVSISLLLYGCGPATTKPSTDTAVSENEQQAMELSNNGQYGEAAEKYLELVELNRNKANYYKLKATNAYIDGDNFDHARHILKTLDEKTLTAQQVLYRDILTGWITLSEGKPDTVIQILTRELPPETPPELLAEYYEVRAFAYEQNQQYIEAVNERSLLGNYLVSPDEQTKNYDVLWSLLANYDVETLDSLRTSQPDYATSWIELALINKTIKGSSINLETAIETWAQRYPGHPAQNKIIPELISTSIEDYQTPQQIALLLPDTPQLREASNAIQEGFMAAWYAQENEKPVIKIYHANAKNILESYQFAVNEGAELIIGPLDKESVTTLIDNNAVTVKTILLNNYDGEKNTTEQYGNPSVIQFSLSPEDEARQVAERAWFEGLANVLIITPDTTWGERVYSAFQSSWDQLGGRTLEHIRLGTDAQEYSVAIEQVLNIDISEQRSKLLKAKLNRKLHTEPRRRHDADFIFIAANPTIGRQLMPQLRYYRAEDLPVYSISSIYTGINNAQADRDIDNLIFADMPWVVDPARNYSALQTTLNNSRNQTNSNFKRLYAFGIDAFNLIYQLGNLVSNPNFVFKGETGSIKMDKTGKLQRQLIWVKFVNGIPELIDPVSIN